MTDAAPVLPGVIDSHAHLHMEPLSTDVDTVLQRARAAGVAGMITIGTTVADSRQAVQFVIGRDDVWATAGVHPHEVETMNDADLEEITALAGTDSVVAVGEIGLDFHYDHSPRDLQMHWFRRQLAAAVALDLPVVVHSRNAEAQTAEVLAEFPTSRGVLHCFSSGVELAQAALAQGWYVSFSGIVTFRNADSVREAARMVPLERMLVETDCPYLAPVPHRGRTNEPAMVTWVAACLAEIKGVTPQALVAATAANTRALFALPG